MPNLAELQNTFLNHIFDPNTDHAGHYITSDDRFTAQNRLQVYQNNTSLILQDLLENSFPILVYLLGDAFFKHMAKSFIHLMPPQSPNMNHYGTLFPSFLESQEALKAHPYIPDIAKLEWLRHESYISPILPAMDAENLQQVAARNNGDIQLKIQPHVKTLASTYPVYEIWSDIDENGEDATLDNIDLSPQKSYTIIYRQNTQTLVWSVPYAIYIFIKELENNTFLSNIIDRHDEYFTDIEPQDIIGLCVKNGLIVKQQ